MDVPNQMQVRKKKKLRKKIEPFLYLLPALLFFVGFTYYPFAKTIFNSFFLVNSMGEIREFVGLENYISVLTNSASLKTILTGIPLRVIDVLGCGGFVLSNYQEELMEYFNAGEELVVYENIEDLFYKAKYYLEHEDERKQVALAGFERVKRDFTFRERLQTMYGEHK